MTDPQPSRPFDATLPTYPFCDPADKRRFLQLVLAPGPGFAALLARR